MHLPERLELQQGRYTITRFLASGGFGATYQGIDNRLKIPVAIKEFFVKDFCERDESSHRVTLGVKTKSEFVNRLRSKFLEEARALAKMHHQGIVHVYDVFEEYDTAYYVMDFIDGRSLEQILSERAKAYGPANAPLSEAEALGYMQQVADALRYVHSLNRLHLDIKPANIMVDRKGRAVLIDFGVSKQYDEVGESNTSTLLGMTPAYAAPEQMSNNVATFRPATDIYALGCTLFALLAGKPRPSLADIAVGVEAPPLPAYISEATRRTLDASMAFNIQQRPQSVDEFMALLQPAFQGVNAAPSQSPYISNPNQYNSNPNQYNSNPNQYNSNPNQYNSNPNQYNSNPNPYNSNPNPYNSDPNPYAQSPHISEPTRHVDSAQDRPPMPPGGMGGGMNGGGGGGSNAAHTEMLSPGGAQTYGSGAQAAPIKPIKAKSGHKGLVVALVVGLLAIVGIGAAVGIFFAIDYFNSDDEDAPSQEVALIDPNKTEAGTYEVKDSILIDPAGDQCTYTGTVDAITKMPSGKGRAVYDNGYFAGDFANGLPNGEGVWEDDRGEFRFEGTVKDFEYVEGKLVYRRYENAYFVGTFHRGYDPYTGTCYTANGVATSVIEKGREKML